MSHTVNASELPGTSSLYQDYLNQTESITPFFEYRFSDVDHLFLQEESFLPVCSPQLIAVLERQNREFGSSELTFTHIQHLKNGARTIVTGQQLGLFGGPLYTIYKALTACKLAAQWQEMYDVPCVPVFWLEAFDHDFAEVNHIDYATLQNELRRLSLPQPDNSAQIVSQRRLGDEIRKIIDSFVDDNPVTDFLPAVLALLNDTYRPEYTFSGAFGRFLAQLMATYGLVLFNPLDEACANLYIPVFQKAVSDASALDSALQSQTNALKDAGYHQQIQLRDSQLHLFYTVDGIRQRIRIEGDQFQAGLHAFSETELCQEIEAHPLKFTTDVVLRPILQDILFPTVAYVAGPGEIAYFAQLKAAYHLYEQAMPLIYPRASFTIIEGKIRKSLAKYHLSLTDVFLDSKSLFRRVIGDVDIDLAPVFAQVHANMSAELRSLAQLVGSIDPNLASATENALQKIKYQIDKLEERSIAAQQKNQKVITGQLAKIQAHLYPNGNLQERVFNIVYYLIRYGFDLIKTIYGAIDDRPVAHRLIEL